MKTVAGSTGTGLRIVGHTVRLAAVLVVIDAAAVAPVSRTAVVAATVAASTKDVR